MPLKSHIFSEIYNRKSKELLGKPATEQEVTQAFQAYVALTEFTGHDGELLFMKDPNADRLKVNFDPSC